MKKMLVLIMAVLMIIGINGLVTGCGTVKDEEIVLRDYHGYYGDSAWSACEEDYEDYKNSGVDVSDIGEEYIYGERVYYFYTLYTIAD